MQLFVSVYIFVLIKYASVYENIRLENMIVKNLYDRDSFILFCMCI